MLSGLPLGAGPTDTGEFMLGRVAVTPVLFDSNGSIDANQESWTTVEIDDYLAKVREAVDWWTDTLAGVTTRHQLEFVIDPTFANTPFVTGYEPISRTSDDFTLYSRQFLDAQGYQSTSNFQSAVYKFNHDQRLKLGTDWAFTIFVADSSDDRDGQFGVGGAFSTAFAFAGGQFIVTPSTRPASTITHEIGHIFWARDEYPGGVSWTERRGYYNTQNTNAADNPTPGFVQEPSIMRGGNALEQAYVTHTSPASTLAMIGWQDSDGDGVFDVLDVPMELDAIGSYDPSTSLYRLVGSAKAATLPNQNSSGTQSDITLNRISRIEYQLDNGPWQIAAEPDQQVVDDLNVVVSLGTFETIRWRAVDAVTGITSNELLGTRTLPALVQDASLGGSLFMDLDQNGVRSSNESFVSGATIRLTMANQSPIPRGVISAADFTDEQVTGNPFVSLHEARQSSAREVFSNESIFLAGQSSFQFFDANAGQFSESWGGPVSLLVNANTTIGEATITGFGISRDSRLRIEAHDVNGNLIQRVTSAGLSNSQLTTLSINDPQGRISSLSIFGHAGSRIGVNRIEFGPSSEHVTDASGIFQFKNLPPGAYHVEFEPINVTWQADPPTKTIDVSSTFSPSMAIPVNRVDSPFFNELMPGDVNLSGEVTAGDALDVINDLNLNSPRLIGRGETSALKLDVNNDGQVTAADALMVINILNLRDRSSGSEFASFAASEILSETNSETDEHTKSMERSNLVPLEPKRPKVDGMVGYARDEALLAWIRETDPLRRTSAGWNVGASWNRDNDSAMEFERGTEPKPDIQSRAVPDDNPDALKDGWKLAADLGFVAKNDGTNT